MTSRERIRAALDHRETGRVPVDFSGHFSSGISAIAYNKLRRYLDLPEKPIRIMDPGQQLAVVDDDVLDLFGVDTIMLGRAFWDDPMMWGDWIMPDGSPCQMPVWTMPERETNRWVIKDSTDRVVSVMPDGALYFEQAYWPFAESDDRLGDLAEVLAERGDAGAAPPGPMPAGEDGARKLAEGAKRLRSSTERAIMGVFGGSLFEFGQSMYGGEAFFMMLAAEPSRVHRFLDAATELHMAALERYLGEVGGSIDVIVFGDDLGMQTGPLMSPAMYRDYFKPRHAALWKQAKQLADVRVNLHSCGDISALIPDLIDAGLDSVNPVQISCPGMDLARLKREFGADLTFWGGGCDTRAVLPNAKPRDIARHVREQVAVGRIGGGFVFQQVHNVMADIPPENIAAMFETLQSINREG